MTHPCWVIKMIILSLSLLNSSLAGPPRPASTSKFKVSQFSKGQHSGLKRPCSIQTDESETQLIRGNSSDTLRLDFNTPLSGGSS
ncbi:uncharacterized protein PGTG_12214 [Puccinia graminis f. sp. tritici CRL 75-36-700-3]|uniref:Uncharacterized protein n=1 Tax=Puccinia graminis f. sp. tritici (strain CRL 75-36-700-3 / race SCCL) TaxID=418459 RepID=E3KPM3_PUCGT|nr:uncharacterized protein PGTG_12214 [Puccinia graminis f. sp. tritici CRL 75-36-700-3]EFP86258.2 hypothetical protein PGTG_12214 [Puccinia graminis f. sp. tritici CRL 75-36-700-3]